MQLFFFFLLQKHVKTLTSEMENITIREKVHSSHALTEVHY